MNSPVDDNSENDYNTVGRSSALVTQEDGGID